MSKVSRRAQTVPNDNAGFEAWLLQEFAQQADCAMAPEQVDELTMRIDEELAKVPDASFANTLRHLERARERVGRRSTAA
jgi:hypothetical protein